MINENIIESIKYIIKNTKGLSLLLSIYDEIKKRKSVRYFKKNGYRINNLIYEALKGKITYYTWAGTLLGVIRENGFIKYDDDLDYGIRINSEEDWITLKNALEKNKFKLLKYYTVNNQIRELTFCYKSIHVDFFRETINENNKSYLEAFYRIREKHYNNREYSIIRINIQPADTFKEIIINDSHFFVPDNYESYLEANYGKEWRIPNKDKSNQDMFGNKEKIQNIMAKKYYGKEFPQT